MANKYIDGDVEVNFTEAQSRQSLESGESVKTLFGKLRKWLSDLKPVAFSGSYNDLTDKTMTGYTKPASTSAITTSDTINQAIGKLEKGLEDAGGESSTVSSWSELQETVRNGSSGVLLKEQFSCHRNNSILTWDVIGINHDIPAEQEYTNSLTLRLHDQFPDPLQFDAKEAMYYCEEELPSKKYYYFTTDNDVSYYFYLNQTIPKGGQISFEEISSSSQTTRTIKTYKSQKSMVELETITSLTSGTRGTYLGKIGNSLNKKYSMSNGSFDYKESAIRQWLNSDKPVGEWWEPQNKWDRPPSCLMTHDGFMYGLDKDFLSAIRKTKIIVNRYNWSPPQGYYELEDYFFLLSNTEVGISGSSYQEVDEGSLYPIYTSANDRITYRNGTKSNYFLRTNSAGVSVVTVSTSGSGSSTNAAATNGIIIACNII